MNEAKIIACPFCGSEAKLTTTTCDLTIGHRHTVICAPGCGASGQWADSPASAIEAWNKRAGDREPQAAPNSGDIAGSVSANGSAISEQLLNKMDACRHLLPDPGPEVAGQLIAEIRRLRGTLSWIAGQQNLFFAECSQAEEIVARCKEALSPNR